MENFFLELTVILIIASVISILFRYLKQPPIMAYILTGILVAQLTFFSNESKISLEMLSRIGITLLLFVLGLEFKVLELRSVGKVSFITAISHIAIATVVGFIICSVLGFSPVEALFLAFALTFSSTIIIVKLLSDKKDLTSLHGKIAVGYLLVQDFCAILSLIFLAGFHDGQAPGLDILMISLVKALFLITITIIFSQYVFPKLIHSLSRSSEILFVASLAWAFGMASLVSSSPIGFSIEIGGFLAGLALANSEESTQIISKVKSLRDFFIVLFFVVLGTQLNFSDLDIVIVPALILSVFVLIGTPVTVMIILGLLGYKSRTSFLVGLSVAQISEFSLSLIILGQQLGQVSEKAVGVVTIVAIITFTLSTYLITNGDKVYDLLSPYLKIFERKGKNLEIYTATKDLNNHIVLLGADRMGRSMLKTLKDQKEDILVMDFNPDITKNLKDDGYNVIFGDIADEDILNKAGLDKAKIILSTISDFEDNIILLNFLKLQMKNKEFKPIIIVTSHLENDKTELMEAGANYVIMPYHSAGKYLAKLIRSGQIEDLI
ncbi:MAG: cation:proton antiporter [Candidatus Dojkabacteria bacterium]